MAYLSCLCSCLGLEAGTDHGRPPTPRDQEDLVESDSHRGEMLRPAHSWLIPAPPERPWSLAEPAREPDVPGPEQLGGWWQQSSFSFSKHRARGGGRTWGGGFSLEDWVSGRLAMEDAQLDYAKEPHISTSLRPVSPGIHILGLKVFRHSEDEAQRGRCRQSLQLPTPLWTLPPTVRRKTDHH